MSVESSTFWTRPIGIVDLILGDDSSKYLDIESKIQSGSVSC